MSADVDLAVRHLEIIRKDLNTRLDTLYQERAAIDRTIHEFQDLRDTISLRSAGLQSFMPNVEKPEGMYDTDTSEGDGQ